MAQSQKHTVVYEQFYGWYKLVDANFKKHKHKLWKKKLWN